MCKTTIENLLALSEFKVLKADQQKYVLEACLGYYILNEPPAELEQVVCEVSERFIDLLSRVKGGELLNIVGYIASHAGKFYGMLEEVPATDEESARAQIVRALSCSSIAVRLNVHRTLVKVISGMSTFRVLTGGTGRTRIPINKEGTQTNRYGAVELMGGLQLQAITQLHIPASSQFSTTGPLHPFNMPAVSGSSGTTEMMLKVAGSLKLSGAQQRWYCLGILGLLLAPGAHSLHEVGMTLDKNAAAQYWPRYRYCGLLAVEMQKAPWYMPLLRSVGSATRYAHWNDLDVICYTLAKNRLFRVSGGVIRGAVS